MNAASPRLTLLTASGVCSLIVLDTNIVAVTLPSIARAPAAPLSRRSSTPPVSACPRRSMARAGSPSLRRSTRTPPTGWRR